MIKSLQLLLSMMLPVCLILYPGFANAQGPLPPLTRDELIEMFQRPIFQRNPNRVLTDFVKVNKISFLPTKSAVKYLNDNGVPNVITDQLKYNFASHIVYRVCQFEPVQGEGAPFTKMLNTVLETDRDMIKSRSSGILRDKTFEPVPCDAKGPTKAELENNMHNGYVLIMGELENKPGSADIVVTARLVFVSKIQEKMSITKPFQQEIANTEAAKLNLARRIAAWAINEVENQVL